jgi:hypothetical protein
MKQEKRLAIIKATSNLSRKDIPTSIGKKEKMKENKAQTQTLIEEFNTLEDTLTVLLALKDTPTEREKVEEELLLAFAQFRTTLENLAEGENK